MQNPALGAQYKLLTAKGILRLVPQLPSFDQWWGSNKQLFHQQVFITLIRSLCYFQNTVVTIIDLRTVKPKHIFHFLHENLITNWPILHQLRVLGLHRENPCKMGWHLVPTKQRHCDFDGSTSSPTNTIHPLLFTARLGSVRLILRDIISTTG